MNLYGFRGKPLGVKSPLGVDLGAKLLKERAMRRAEFVCDDLGLITSHLDEIQYDVMSIPDTPLPYALPLSFCYLPPLPSSQISTPRPNAQHFYA